MTLKPLIYASLLGGASAISLFKMLIYAKFLAVEDFGVISLILTSFAVVTYVSSLGTGEGLLKLASMEINNKKREALCSSGLIYGSLIVASLGSILLIVTYFIFLESGWEYMVALLLLGFSSYYFNIIEVCARSGMQLELFAGMVFFKSLLSFLLGGVALLVNIPVMIIANEAFTFMLVASVSAVYFLKTPITFLKAKHKLTKKLIAHGFPIALSNLLKKLALTTDRWIIAFFLGSVVLAEYSFVMLIYLFGISTIGILNTAIGPSILRELGKTKSVKITCSKLNHIFYLSFFPIVAFLASIYFIYPVLISAFFDHYATQQIFTSAMLISIGMIAVFFITFMEWILIGKNKSHILLRINSFIMVVTVLIFGSLSYFGSSIVAFSLAFASLRWLSFVMVKLTIRSIYFEETK